MALWLATVFALLVSFIVQLEPAQWSAITVWIMFIQSPRLNYSKIIWWAFGTIVGAFVAVTGVSGSGKSSLVHEILYNTLARKLHRARTSGAAHDEILGQKILEPVETSDGFENPTSSGDCRADGEAHALDHARHEDPGQKIGVDAGGL